VHGVAHYSYEPLILSLKGGIPHCLFSLSCIHTHPEPFLSDVTVVAEHSECILILKGCFPPCCGDNSTVFTVTITSPSGTNNTSLRYISTALSTFGMCNNTAVLNFSINPDEFPWMIEPSGATVSVHSVQHNITYSLNSTLIVEHLSRCLEGELHSHVHKGFNHTLLQPQKKITIY